MMGSGSRCCSFYELEARDVLIVKIVPQWETFHACPWTGQGKFNVTEVLCQVHESGDMTSFCYYDPRQTCKKLIEQLESEFGLQMYSANEYEFFIC